MYQEQSSEELVLSVGEVIQYELSNGEVMDGEVMDVSVVLNMVKVLPLGLFRIPQWVDADDILSDEDIEFTFE